MFLAGRIQPRNIPQSTGRKERGAHHVESHFGEQSNDQRDVSKFRKWRWLCRGAEWHGMRKWTATVALFPSRLRFAPPPVPVLASARAGTLFATTSTADSAPLWCHTER